MHWCSYFQTTLNDVHRHARLAAQYLVRMKLRPIDPTDLIAASGGEEAIPASTPSGVPCSQCSADCGGRYCAEAIIEHTTIVWLAAGYGEELHKLPFVNGTEGAMASACRSACGRNQMLNACIFTPNCLLSNYTAHDAVHCTLTSSHCRCRQH